MKRAAVAISFFHMTTVLELSPRVPFAWVGIVIRPAETIDIFYSQVLLMKNSFD